MKTSSGIQVDNGEFTRLHNTILEKLALARLSASEYRCLMFLFRMTYGWQRKEHEISMTEWAKGVGIDSAKRHNVWRTLQGMMDQCVIYAKSNGNNRPMTWGFNKNFDQWDASLFDETVITQDNSLDDKPVIPDDNTFEPTVITQDNSTVIKPDNTSVITCDNTHIRRKKYIKKVKEKEIAADAAPSAPKAKDHLAVKAYRDLYERFPTTAQMKIISQRDPPIDDWVRAIRAWAAAGYKPTNIEGMLDWAFNPNLIKERSYRNGAGNGTHRKNSAAHSEPADGGDSPELDPAIQQRMDAHRERRRAEGSPYYQ